MAPAKKPRACDACHSIKIKCELGSTGDDPPCSRCQRLGKECVVTPPKRQKDRVAELEAQVEALTRLLQAQNIQTTPASVEYSSAPSSAESAAAEDVQLPQAQGEAELTKKRRFDETALASGRNGDWQESGKHLDIDRIVSKNDQRQIVRKYIETVVPSFPLVPLTGDTSYEALRKDRPVLLQAIIYASCTGILHDDDQEEIAKVVIELLVSSALSDGEKTIDLVKALLIGFTWFRSPRYHTHVAIFHFLPMTFRIAEEIGIGGEDCLPAPGRPLHLKHVDNVDAWRTWLVCHLLSSTMAILMRRQNPREWTARDESGLQMLGYSMATGDWDRLACQYVRAERLCERIAHELGFFDKSSLCDITDPATQSSMRKLHNLVIDFKVQIPPALQTPMMSFWEHVAMVYTHEVVLHTSTNKDSFAAPFLAEILSATDFPAPLVVTQEHLSSLNTLTTACHSVIDLFCSLEIQRLISLPVLVFAARIAYSNVILTKIYIACTAVGSTFGAFFDLRSLRLDEYLSKVNAVYLKVTRIDARCGAARVLGSTKRLQEWLENYRISIVDCSHDSRVMTTTKTSDLGYPPFESSDNWFNMDVIDTGLTMNLDEIFADAALTDLFPNLT